MASFFRRGNSNAPMIPPVASEPGSSGGNGMGSGLNMDPSNRRSLFSSASSSKKGDTGAGGNGGGLNRSNTSMTTGSTQPPPSYRSSPGDPYGDAARDNNRQALLGDYQPPEGQQKPDRKYGYDGRENEEDFDEDEEIEGIKHEMREVKQESLASTRNALRIAREAEETARGTIAKLGDQSERIANTERYLDIAKANNQRAEDKAAELKQLNKSIFKPVITWNKDAKRQAQEDRVNARHLQEWEDREKARQDVIQTNQRLGKAAMEGAYNYGNEPPRPGQQAGKKLARQRYQFEATGSDDELEDEIDDNLEETLKVTENLKRLAMAAGEEIDNHNKRLVGITDKTGTLDNAILRNTERLKRAGGKY